MLQLVLTYFIVALSIGYAIKSIYKSVKSANNPCYGCDGCALKELKMKQNKPCPNKK